MVEPIPSARTCGSIMTLCQQSPQCSQARFPGLASFARRTAKSLVS
jgi:hypothetical protein